MKKLLSFLFVVVIAPAVDGYCPSTSTASGFEWISMVTLNGATQASGSSTLTTWPGTFVQLNAGETYTLEVEITLPDDPGFCPKDELLAAWIDLNRNDSYLNTAPPIGELLDFGGTKVDLACDQTYTFNHVFSIDAGNVTGTTGLRVALRYVPTGGTPDPCLTTFAGEVEDFTVEILPPVPVELQSFSVE